MVEIIVAAIYLCATHLWALETRTQQKYSFVKSSSVTSKALLASLHSHIPHAIAEELQMWVQLTDEESTERLKAHSTQWQSYKTFTWHFRWPWNKTRGREAGMKETFIYSFIFFTVCLENAYFVGNKKCFSSKRRHDRNSLSTTGLK